MEIIVCLTTNGVVVTVNAGSITFRYTAVIEESMTRFLAGSPWKLITCFYPLLLLYFTTLHYMNNGYK